MQQKIPDPHKVRDQRRRVSPVIEFGGGKRENYGGNAIIANNIVLQTGGPSSSTPSLEIPAVPWRTYQQFRFEDTEEISRVNYVLIYRFSYF